jgi:hypothetical protein
MAPIDFAKSADAPEDLVVIVTDGSGRKPE